MYTGKKIKHMVIFSLMHEVESPESAQFLADGRDILSSIPGVEDFEVFRQVSSKNKFDFGFSMVFANQAAYDLYNAHSLHVDFVANRWVKEVSDFLEIDFHL
jgi:hypothetical protein